MAVRAAAASEPMRLRTLLPPDTDYKEPVSELSEEEMNLLIDLVKHLYKNDLLPKGLPILQNSNEVNLEALRTLSSWQIVTIFDSCLIPDWMISAAASVSWIWGEYPTSKIDHLDVLAKFLKGTTLTDPDLFILHGDTISKLMKEAVKKGKVNMLALLLIHGGDSLVNKIPSPGKEVSSRLFLLHLVAGYGKKEILQLALKSVANPHEIDYLGLTALDRALGAADILTDPKVTPETRLQIAQILRSHRIVSSAISDPSSHGHHVYQAYPDFTSEASRELIAKELLSC